MGIKSLFLISCLFFTSSAWAQEADNSKKLPKECELKLRLKGTSKHDAADHDFAMQYQGVELIWLHFDKSEKGEGLPAAKRVFLVSEKMENDGIVEYLIYKKDFEEGMNAPIFPDWKSNANKFYLASCFDAWVAP